VAATGTGQGTADGEERAEESEEDRKKAEEERRRAEEEREKAEEEREKAEKERAKAEKERAKRSKRGALGISLLAFGILLLALAVVLSLADYATDDSPTPETTPADASTPVPAVQGEQSAVGPGGELNGGGAELVMAVAGSTLVRPDPAAVTDTVKDWLDEWWAFPGAILAIIAVLLIAIGAGVAYWNGALWSDTETGFAASLFSLVPVMLTIAAGATVVIYLLPIEAARDGSVPSRAERWEEWGSFLAPALGLFIAGAVGIALALFNSDRAKASTADPHITNELKTRWLALHARFDDWCPPEPATTTPPAQCSPPDWNDAERAACGEARHALRSLQLKLDFHYGHEPQFDRPANEQSHPSVGPEWIIGTGFVDAWMQLHGAEEALFYVAPKEHLVGQALNDEMRLKDSRIANHDDMLFKLRWAVVQLGGKDYLTPSPQPPALPENTEANVPQARAVLREIRHAINEFRDARRDGLVRARNYLSWTGLLTGAFGYALLGTAILVQVPREFVVAAVVFYLVGASVGLFNQLRTSATNAGTQTEEDFGLSRAQLVYSPVLSGLAAVFGVVLTALLYASLTGSVIVYQAPLAPTSTPAPTAEPTPGGDQAAAESPEADSETSPAAGEETAEEPSPAAGDESAEVPSPTATSESDQEQPMAPLGVASPDQLPRLIDIFDLTRNRFGLVLAAVFGLVPGLLVDRLQGVANRYKADLSSTSTQQNSTG
jgi:hypothetical protein